MTRLFKLVVLALALVVGIVPIFGDGSCFPTKANSGMHCPPGCPMMAKMANHELRGMGRLPSCCRVPCSTPVRRTEIQGPSPAADVAVQPADEFAGALLATAKGQRDYQIPLPDSACSQSVLCTFLI